MVVGQLNMNICEVRNTTLMIWAKWSSKTVIVYIFTNTRTLKTFEKFFLFLQTLRVACDRCRPIYLVRHR